MRVAVIGAGWAGLAASVDAVQAGHAVTVFEAARLPGGRARSLPAQKYTHLPDGGSAVLDNGQHILIGAYTHTLQLMQRVGIDPARVLLALPLTLRFPDGAGLALPRWPAPLDAAWGILTARGWGWRDKASLLHTAMAWQRAKFHCAPSVSVADLCRGLTPRVLAGLIEPLCVSALNTPADRSSGQVFLRVLRDSLFGKGHGRWGGSNLLLPLRDLGEVFPEAAVRWLTARGVNVLAGRRVQSLALSHAAVPAWQVDDQVFDAVILACPVREAVRLVESCGVDARQWLQEAAALEHEAIATVYASTGATRGVSTGAAWRIRTGAAWGVRTGGASGAASGHALPQPLLALHSTPEAPAQFVFDRGQLGGPAGLLAFVVSASRGDRETIERQVLAQAAALGWDDLQPVQTVIEKRATFACTPGVRRPAAAIAPGLLACGDYVAGPYPATLEGAVRSGQGTAAMLGFSTR